MYLKELTLRGFKSFANPTTLRFEPGITAIVGPNGSGKSNIVDALAWVMGEQGARALRGSSMEDVIFSGTATRPPLGRAHVSLTIDNSDHALNIDYDEVTISRTLFRNGGSEYAINGSPVRLLDIQDLLSDAGLGQQMHVIVGQGQLSRILNADPQGHRSIIEEAAGILKHRKRKQRSLHRLSTAKANLDRLDDLLGEIDRQMRPLARQAKASRRAEAIHAIARDASARLLADDAARLLKARETNARKLGTVRADLREKRLNLAHIRMKIETLEEHSDGSDPKLARLEEHLHRLMLVDGRFESLAALAGERSRAATDSLAQLDAHRISNPEMLRAHADELAKQLIEAKERKENAQQRYQKATQTRADAESRLASLRQTLSQLRAAQQDHASQISRLEQLLAAQKSTLHAFDQRLSDTRKHSSEVSTRLAANRKEVARLSAHQENAGTALDAQLASERAALANIARTLQETAAEKTDCDNKRIRLVARSEALQDTIRSRHDGSSFQHMGVHSLGPVSQHMHVAEGWEDALAAALSVFSDALVVAKADQIPQALAQARAHKAERTALLAPLARAASTASSQQSVEKASSPVSSALADLSEGKVVPAIHLLSFPPARQDQLSSGLRSSLSFLLKGIGVTRSAETAFRACREKRWRMVVTKQGEVVTPAAAVTVALGSPSDLALVARKNAADKQAAALAQTIDQINTKISHLTAQRDTHRSTLSDLTRKRDAARLQVSRNEEALAIRTKQVSADERELDEIAESARRLRTQRQEALEKQSDLAHTLEQTRSTVSPATEENDLTEREKKSEHDLSVARDEEVQEQLAAKEADRRTASLDNQIGLLNDEAQSAAQEKAARQTRRARLANRRDGAAKIARRISGIRKLLDACIVQARARRTAAGRAADHNRQELASLRKQRDACEPQITDLTNQEHSLDLEREREATQLGEIEEKASSRTGLSLDDLVRQYGPDQPVPDSSADGQQTSKSSRPYVRQEQQKRLAAAQKQIARLGKVNPLAGEEYEALQERRKYLSDQREDVSSSRKRLLGLVDQLDTTMKEVFTSAFNDISTAYSRIFADLFPGGKGRLRLDDPDHPLTSGVIIEASPAGKKVRELSLLSGGEKSLSALALLLAISAARPSPFYVMDEVEAALDDLNLTRLLGELKRMGKHVQLIIITHQQRTMAIADALYGVSMRADGVTAVISQKMDDVLPASSRSGMKNA